MNILDKQFKATVKDTGKSIASTGKKVGIKAGLTLLQKAINTGKRIQKAGEAFAEAPVTKPASE